MMDKFLSIADILMAKDFLENNTGIQCATWHPEYGLQFPVLTPQEFDEKMKRGEIIQPPLDTCSKLC